MRRTSTANDDALGRRVLKALRLAQLAAMEEARSNGKPIYICVDGKVKAVKPWLRRKRRAKRA